MCHTNIHNSQMHKSQYILFWCDSSDKIANAYDKLQLSFLLIMKCAFPQYLLPYDSSDIPSILKAFRVFVMFEVKLCSLLKEFRTNAFYIISISKTENKISQLRNMISSFCRTERKKNRNIRYWKIFSDSLRILCLFPVLAFIEDIYYFRWHSGKSECMWRNQW